MVTMDKIWTALLLLGASLGSITGKEFAEHGSHHVQSDKHHIQDGEHNPHFDHEAILGSRQLEEEFDHLSPEESKRRLSLLVAKMDVDRDGYVSKKELTDWVLQSFGRIDAEDSLEEFKKLDSDEDEKVTWKEYLSGTYGFNKNEMEGFEDLEEHDHEDFDKMMIDDKTKFGAADVDKDGFLTVEEFKAFTHPYDYEHMHQVELARAKKEFDTDKDNFVSKKEYFQSESTAESEREIEIYEEEQFKLFDKNGDGKLDDEELVDWVLPNNVEAAKEEADHLFGIADGNEDGSLSEEEILEKYDEFVGSQVTNYGNDLHHDEL